ncbi:hypothetical protein NQZ68_031923 [Dissostichus eleginoides]|nr:hypothetical protein NQZ68_031923 [Dissostichus eleginoides]
MTQELCWTYRRQDVAVIDSRAAFPLYRAQPASSAVALAESGSVASELNKKGQTMRLTFCR